MPEIKGKFDLSAYHKALEATVQSRNLNWKQVASATGVSASTLTRMGQGKAPDAEGLARLSNWSGLNPGVFVAGSQPQSAETLAAIATALTNDPRLTKEGKAALDAMIRTTYKSLTSSS